MKAKFDIIEHNTYWLLSLNNTQVNQCIFDHAFSFNFLLDDYNLTTKIENKFTLTTPNERVVIDPESMVETAKALVILRKKVESFKIYKNGKLRISFSDDITIECEPHKKYEAWHVVGTDRFLVVCLADGELDIFNGEE